MNNDGSVDVDEDNCDLDYGAAGNLISKNHGGKSIFTSRTIYSFCFPPFPFSSSSLTRDWKLGKICLNLNSG